MPLETDQLALGLNPETASPDALFEETREEARFCKNCPLWEPATQTVFGEGPAPAPVMLVGEQPGDKEDIAGKPFVGPAGRMLDGALKDAGIDRTAVYVTNAVKHFKFVPRGKIRLHQKPVTMEIRACHPWLQHELGFVNPDVVVAMGATAAQSVFGKALPIGRNRGRLLEIGSAQALVTVHPSYLLRIKEAAEAEVEYDKFVSDLKLLQPFVK